MTEALFREDAYLRRCEARVVAIDADGIRLDRTVFYPLGGGQPGDSGHLLTSDGRRIEIADTRKGPDGILHLPAQANPALFAGATVIAEIDWARRYRHMRMHTCLHLLCAVVQAGVTGGSIAASKGRLDFDLPESTLDKEAVTEALNALIREDHAVGARWISEDELDAHPELVRTMSVAPPRGTGQVRLLEVKDVDLQPCGGTHVAGTAEIGPVMVRKIEKKSRHNRRVIINFAD